MIRWQQFFKGEKIDRTIHVIKFECAHGKQSHIQSAYKRFKRFGSVDTIRTGCVDCLFIQYKTTEDATKLLKIGQIEIDNIEFKIFPADRFHDQVTGCCTHNEYIFTDQANNDAIITQDSSKDIFDTINDDCLREIFRKIQHFVDFYSIANVCIRFNNIAMEIFSLKIKQKIFSMHELSVNGDATLCQLENFLTMFGTSIHAAYINFDELNLDNTPDARNLALKLFNNHCKNLRSLHICIKNNENKINLFEIRSVLPMLTYLKIDLLRDVNTLDTLTDFISACCRLETMIINCAWKFTLILPEITFPKLVKFKLPYYEHPNLDRFLKHNTQLEKISCFSFDHCRFIGLNMLNLKKLTIQGGTTIEDDVVNSKFLNENVKMKLENLFTDGNDIENVNQLKNITNIWAEVWTPFGANHLISIAQNQQALWKLTLSILDSKIKYPIDMVKPMLRYANQLSEIRIIARNGLRIRFNEKDFEEILKVVECRPNSTKLNITITNSFNLSNKWQKEKIIAFDEKSNRLNVISHYVMPGCYY